MREILLLIAVLAMFCLIYYLANRISRFVSENGKSVHWEEKDPTGIMLSSDLSDEEILEEIKNYRRNHEGVRIFLYDRDQE